MAVGLFLAPYKRLAAAAFPSRYCAMDDFTAAILADGGVWSEAEILGNQAIVKVRASAATLASINAAPGVTRIPLDTLAAPLSSLTPAQRTAVRNQVLAAGYSAAEVNAAIPDFSLVTVRDVLVLLATRRLLPRYDSGTDTIVTDGVPQPCKSVDQMDVEVSNS